jgi:hypothetical protein
VLEVRVWLGRCRNLNHVISAIGVAMDRQKVHAFLGLAGYYKCFIKGYDTIVVPLTALLYKDAFRWNADAEFAFHTLQSAFMMVPILQLPVFNEPFIVECDASGVGINVVLDQGHGPVAFFSQQLAPRHAAPMAYERELMGLVLVVRPGGHICGGSRS